MIIQNEQIDLPTSYGPMRTYVYRPVAAGQYPGLILFTEIFQQTAPIKRTAALFAGHGFVVAVPEIFHELNPIGTVLAYDQAGTDKGNSDKITKDLASYDQDARIVLDYLKKSACCNGKFGSVGICIGGHLAFRAAMNPEVLAGVCFYATDIHKRGLGLGTNDDSLDRIKELKAEMLMIWGRQDPHIPPEGRALVYKALTEAGITFSWHEFSAQHAFIRDEGPRYDPELAIQCYSLAINLFRRKLGNTAINQEADSKQSIETKH